MTLFERELQLHLEMHRDPRILENEIRNFPLIAKEFGTGILLVVTERTPVNTDK